MLIRVCLQKAGSIRSFAAKTDLVTSACSFACSLATFGVRCSGTLTGSRSAGAAGRMPLLDVCQLRLGEWSKKSFSVQGQSFSLASFVDNLLTTSSSPTQAVEILDDCEYYLKQRWGLVYGEDSREYITCKGDCRPMQVPNCWSKVTTMKSLGHHLQDDNGINDCFKAVTGAMWRSFYGNLTQGLLSSSEKVKARFLNANILAVASSRWARWPYQKSYGSGLDSIQRKMLAHLLQIKPAEGEPFDAFVQRRHIICGHKASSVGRWSSKWAQGVVNWSEHVERRHDPKAWSHTALGWHDSQWLHFRRLIESSIGESRTRTRCIRGAPQRRWEEGLQLARQVVQ